MYNQVPLYDGPIYRNITYNTAITVAESESDFKITTDTPYLTLTGELWGVCCEDLGENWQRYRHHETYRFSDIGWLKIHE